jgi:hypothetical protein
MSATRQEIFASQAVTTSGNTTPVDAATLTMLMIGVDITAGSGTVVLDVFLEVSDDGGTTWYECPADQVLLSSGLAGENTVVTDHRSIVDNKTTTAAAKYLAVYKHLPGDVFRVRWILTGTTPSVTMSISFVGK